MIFCRWWWLSWERSVTSHLLLTLALDRKLKSRHNLFPCSTLASCIKSSKNTFYLTFLIESIDIIQSIVVTSQSEIKLDFDYRMESKYQLRIPRVSLSSSGSSSNRSQTTKINDFETSGESEPEAMYSRGSRRKEMYAVHKAPKIGGSTSTSSSSSASNRSNYVSFRTLLSSQITD